MESGPVLLTAKVEKVNVSSLLDVLHANQFERESLDPVVLEQTEVNFYRGSPPQWLNFYISDQAELNGNGSKIIKRDGYNKLVQQIDQRRKYRGTSTVKLFHQPGSGGTTLAMQVLWDLRKKLRCAVLTGPTSDMSNVAKEVVHLFTAGGRGHKNTVLLLVNDEHILENLHDSIMKTVAEQQIVNFIHVVILLCVRKNEILPGEHVSLRLELSDTEKEKLNEKKEELSRRFTDEYTQFHGFNIMQNNFSQDYVKQACTVFSDVQSTNTPQETQLAAFLSLLNAYVPGSYVLESQCLRFLKHDGSIHEDYSLEDIMKSFHHLIVTFQQDETSDRRVCMAHRMIAQQCIEQMAEAGVTRSDTASDFLTCFCGKEVPPWLLGFVKDMLTKREMKKEENPGGIEMKDEQERFSRLILDIQKTEDDVLSASVLEVASNKFDQNSFFPQALARVYYIELKNYKQAEMWAKEAKKRDPQNSFIADTLGQVYKNHLLKQPPVTPREILQLASKSIEAFKHEEELAGNEHGPEGDGLAKVSHVFNARGQFGFLQVCNLLYDLLVDQNSNWREVLTGNVSINSVLKSLGDYKLYRFTDLIISIRDEVERKYAFYDKYLTYSKPKTKRDEASYVSRDVSDCYKKYVGESPPKHVKEKCVVHVHELKQRLAETSAGVLSCIDRKYTESQLKEITTWWEEIYSNTGSLTALGNYILAHIMLLNMGTDIPSKSKYFTTFKQKIPLSPQEAPELHMLALILQWPINSKDKCMINLKELVEHMHSSYELACKKYFRSRYLCPLFFIGKGDGLEKIVHRRVLEQFFLGPNNGEIQDWSNWSEEKIFKDPTIQTRLLRVEGVVRNYGLYVIIEGREIKVDANMRNSLWKTRQVSFYLGFNIKGPVAFDIQTKPTKEDKKE